MTKPYLYFSHFQFLRVLAGWLFRIFATQLSRLTPGVFTFFLANLKGTYYNVQNKIKSSGSVRESVILKKEEKKNRLVWMLMLFQWAATVFTVTGQIVLGTRGSGGWPEASPSYGVWESGKDHVRGWKRWASLQVAAAWLWKRSLLLPFLIGGRKVVLLSVGRQILL